MNSSHTNSRMYNSNDSAGSGPSPPDNTPASHYAYSMTPSAPITSPAIRGATGAPDPTEISDALSLTAAASGLYVGLPTQVPTNTPAVSIYAPTVAGPNLAALDTVGEEVGEENVVAGVVEFNTWEQPAEEDMAAALLRLAQLAEDEWKVDRSASVEERYSRRVAALLAKGPVKFDAKFLE